MSDTKLDLSALQDSITSLEEGLDVVSDSHWFHVQKPAVQNTLIAGIVQNFEFVYEISIKMIRRTIELESASPEDVDETNYRDLLRVAAEKSLIADVEAWFKYRKMRNITAHTYDREKARQVYEGTLEFISDARALLGKLNARNS